MNMFVFSIRRAIFSHLQKCDAQYLVNASTGSILAVLQDYPSQCMHFIIRNMIHLYNAILMALLYGIYLFVIDRRVGLAALLAAVISVFVNTRFKKQIRDLGNEEREAYREYAGWIYEVITALRDIRILGCQKKIENSFEGKQKTLFKIGVKTGISSLTAQNIITFVNLAIRLVIYGIAAYMAAFGNLTLGTLTVIFAFYDKLSNKMLISATIIWTDKTVYRTYKVSTISSNPLQNRKEPVNWK